MQTQKNCRKSENTPGRHVKNSQASLLTPQLVDLKMERLAHSSLQHQLVASMEGLVTKILSNLVDSHQVAAVLHRPLNMVARLMIPMLLSQLQAQLPNHRNCLSPLKKMLKSQRRRRRMSPLMKIPPTLPLPPIVILMKRKYLRRSKA